MKKKKLGEVLRERGHISAGDLSRIVADQQGKVIRLGELMLERALVTKEELASALEAVTAVPYVNCAEVTPDAEVLHLIPRHLAVRGCVFPIRREGKKLVVAMAEPQNLGLSDELKFTSGATISPRLGFRAEIFTAIEKFYGGKVSAAEGLTSEPAAAAAEPESAGPAMEFVSTSTRQANKDAIQEAQAELVRRHTPAVRLTSEVITAASAKHASDIHIEPQVDGVIVRIRVDGVLRDLQRVPAALQNSFISRIKILADMDIAERRNPQDGRFLVKMGTQQIDMRVSSLPTQYGEKIVMRLLNPGETVRGFAELGLPPAVESTLLTALAQPQGMMLVTGPTGSGKSTTLYAALNHLRKPEVNIVTVEDPVEYVLPGVNQVHVNVKAGLTFASCLRSILRQDPNVIMVGEIRDKETAEIAMKAAQTGHLVLSTLHTNDSVAAVTRLIDLGVPSFMISSSISAIMAQRLVRRLCTCKGTEEPTVANLERMEQLGQVDPVSTIFVPKGCELCELTGYRGRVGIYEILPFDETIRDAVRTGVRNEDIRNHMRDIGMKLMQEDALDKIITGMTSIEEITRVVPVHTGSFPECAQCGRRISPTFQFCPHCGVKRKGSASAAPQPSSPARGRSNKAALEGTLKS
ncbi:MAG TPA: ATPase, T2SS/T4P/T4SS family [Candidatus Acidoferrales bacterium]